MLRNYFKTAFRNMRRNKLFTGLNILGLATGLACSILIFFWVQDELSYDRFNPSAEKTFRLTAKVKDMNTALVPWVLAPEMKAQIPGIKNATRIDNFEKIITVGTRKFDEKRIYYVDSNFLPMFNYPLLRGNKASVLKDLNSVVLTEATAIKYFGSVDAAMGQSLYIDDDIVGSNLKVTGVLNNVPTNSHLQFDLLMAMEKLDKQSNRTEPWRYFNNLVYFQLADGVKPEPAVIQRIERQINTLRNQAIVNTAAVPAVLSAQPLTQIHLYSHFSNDVDGQGDIQYVRIFTLAALFILFIAAVNFMNLSTALSGTRAKEVGLRKTIGALRAQLALQFIGESMLLAMMSLGLALLLVYASLPFFNTLASKSIILNLLDLSLMSKVLAITVVVGLLAGSYPAFYISSFNAVKVLKGVKILKGAALRNGLVVLQFSISVILMISTVVIYNQLRYLHDRDLGYNRENLLYIPMPEVGDLKNNADALKSALGQVPQIGSFTIMNELPTNLHTPTPYTWRGMDKGALVMGDRVNVDENFLRTFGMKMAAGKFFSGPFLGNDTEYIINETAARVMGMKPEKALGTMLTIREQEGKIIGVVKDFNFQPVYQPIEPLVMRRRQQGDFLVLRTEAEKRQKILSAVQGCYERAYGSVPFAYGYIDQDLDHLYIAETRMSTILRGFSILSIVISCLGLFGLATFATQRRTKEIGVRKVLGAGEGRIVVLLAREFLGLVAISLLVAFPVAGFLMHQWLQGFVDRVSISGWIFAAAGVSALLIAFVTVSYQTIRAALANPVDALRGNE